MVRVEGASYPLVASSLGQFRNTTESGHYHPESVQVLQDKGCEFSPKCTGCPLPKCRYEYSSIRTLFNELVRDPQIVELRSEGLYIDEIEDRVGVSRRTIHRVLAEANNGH